MLVTRLMFVTGPFAGRRFEIPEEGITVGRSHTAGLTVPDGTLSRIHCRLTGGAEPTVHDLGSSNGSMLNGTPLGPDVVSLKDGDVVSFGECACRVTLGPASDTEVVEKVVSPIATPAPAAVPNLFDCAASVSATASGAPPVAPATEPIPELPQAAPRLFPAEEGADGAADKVDLGLSSEEEVPARKRSPLTGLIFALGALAVLAIGAGVVFSLTGRAPEKQRGVPVALPRELPFELRYERLAIDSSKLFRYTLTFEPDGVLSVVSDDFGADDRSFSKRKKLTAAAVKTLRKLLNTSGYMDIGELPPQRSADGVSLDRRSLTVTMGTQIWSRMADNADNQVFGRLCTQLEEFGEYELELQAARYSVSELQAMGSEQLALAHRYWGQRDLGDDRLFACIMAYRRGVSALETLNPKPPFAEELSDGLHMAEAELQKRYEELRFQVDQARNMQRYDLAAEALRTVLRMIPDRDDERNVKASADLVLIETRYLKRR